MSAAPSISKGGRVHALVLVSDYGYVIRDATVELRGGQVESEAHVDSRTDSIVITKDGATEKCCFQI